MGQPAIWTSAYAEPEQPKRWYALYTRSRHEDVVCQRLAGKTIETFLPKMEVWSRRVDRRQRIQLPLFRGYVFANVAMDHGAWADIIRTSGVVQVLGSPEGCVPVPESQIETVRTLVGGGLLLSPHPYLQVGRRVRVVNGPLAGCEGILLKKGPKGTRLVIAVDIIRRAISVEIEASDVEPA
jgi:transcription antitermination factor NusG